MLLDANILLYAIDSTAPAHHRAREWLESTLSGDVRVALPWQTIGAVVRIATHARVMAHPLTGAQAWSMVRAWLEVPVVWVPATGRHTATILGRLIESHGITGNLIPDAQLAAVAIEHGLTVVTSDADFTRFPEVRAVNPLLG